MTKVWSAICVGCGVRQFIAPNTQSCHCGDNLSVEINPNPESITALKTAAGESSMWRFEPFLPVSRQHASHLQVGNTPLLNLGQHDKCQLMLKDETRNPSGSIKDRASEVVIAVARSQGIRRFVMASTGNAAASLAAIGAATRTEVTVLVPKSVPIAKLAQIRAFGATVHKIDGNYAEACDVAGKIAHATNAVNRTTGLNPFTREGKKTCAFEIAEQLGWQVPDWVIVPTGDGNILSAMAKGFEELLRVGLTHRLPRLVAAQSEAAAPIADDFTNSVTKPAHNTVADSIQVTDPMDRTAAGIALRSSQGKAIVVNDDEISTALMSLSTDFGVFVEPSSAAGFAAYLKLAQKAEFAPGETIVLLGTGTGLKDLRVVTAHNAGLAEIVTAPHDWQCLVPQYSDGSKVA